MSASRPAAGKRRRHQTNPPARLMRAGRKTGEKIVSITRPCLNRRQLNSRLSNQVVMEHGDVSHVG